MLRYVWDVAAHGLDFITHKWTGDQVGSMGTDSASERTGTQIVY